MLDGIESQQRALTIARTIWHDFDKRPKWQVDGLLAQVTDVLAGRAAP